MKRTRQDAQMTFLLRDRTDPVVYSVDVLLRYTPAKLVILDNMVKVEAYHGDTSNVVDGDHGFNLCDDDDIRMDFHTRYTLDQRQHILQQALPRRDHGDSLYMLADCNVLNRYLDWKSERCAQLVQVLHLIHKNMYCTRQKTFPLGAIYRYVNNDTCIVMWAITLRRHTVEISETALIAEGKAKIMSWKRDPFVDDVFMFLQGIRAYAKEKRDTIKFVHDNVHVSERNKKRISAMSLYKIFKGNNIELFHENTWKTCGPAFRYAFGQIVCHGMKYCIVQDDTHHADDAQNTTTVTRNVPDTF